MSHTEYQCSTKNCTGTVLIANVPGNEDNHLDAECDRCDQKRRFLTFIQRGQQYQRDNRLDEEIENHNREFAVGDRLDKQSE